MSRIKGVEHEFPEHIIPDFSDQGGPKAQSRHAASENSRGTADHKMRIVNKLLNLPK
jgi:hypothetical protein